MSMRKIKKQLAAKQFSDGFMNPLLRVGEWTPNTFNANRYVPRFKSFNRQQLEWMYQGSWLCSLAIDLIAQDMTREGIEIVDESPEVVEKINALMDDFLVWDSLCDVLKWSRLFGGAIAIMMIDGDNMSEPLTTVRKGSFRGLYILDRWQVNPSNKVINELGPNFGKPMYYEVIDSECGIELNNKKIHHSRVLRFEGRRLPYYLRQAYMGWGASVLEVIYPQIEAYDLASSGAAQLVSKSYLRYYKVKGLRQILTNAVTRKGFLAQMDHTRLFQNIEGLTLGDADDEFQTFSYTFAGLSEVLTQFGQQVSGGLGIPLVRLFGQSPAGMNATGESDIRNYYDNIKSQQDSQLRPCLKRLLRIMYMSATGETPQFDFSFEFKPLWQMSTEQRAQSAQGLVSSILQAYDSQAIGIEVVLKELRKLSDSIGLFASISDDDIQAAKEMEEGMKAPLPNGLGLNDQGPNQNMEGGTLQGVQPNRQNRGVVPEATVGSGPDGRKNSPGV